MSGKLTAYYDVGTTNLRLYLLDESLEPLAVRKRALGARDSAIAGTNRPLLEGMEGMYRQALADLGRTDADVEAVYASGMVTSPYGLLEVPHYPAPVTDEEFARRAVTPFFEPERFRRELRLISGLKSVGEDISSTNNTRGEEIEVLGILPELERRFPGQQTAVVLPGSHTHVLLAGRGRLEGILSSFTGELFQAVRSQTVLSPVLETPSDHPDPDAARLGLENLRRYGFNRALYIGHAMRIFGEGTPRFRRCYCEAVISGGVIQALDAVCRERWRDCGAALVAAGPYLAELFSLLLEGSEAIRRWETLIISADRSFALEGLRRIIRIRERSHSDE